MSYIRKAYRVPCRRGVSVRLWMENGHPQMFATPIRGATHHVRVSHPRMYFHPLWRLEYIDADGFRLWPIQPDDFKRAELDPAYAGRMAPVRAPKVQP